MNNERRMALQVAIIRLDAACARIEEIMTDEQDEFDNLPEGLQQTELGEAIEKEIGVMEDALGSIEDVKDSLKELTR